jgi:hypothetical protein
VTLDLPTLNLVAGIIVSVLTSLSLIGGLIWRIGRQVDAKFERLEADCMKVEKDTALALAAADARAKMAEDDLRRTIAEHKLFAAEHFATEDGVSKALEPVLRAIDRLADRLDRFLTEGTGQPPAPRNR